MEAMRVVVVGAGASGLVTARVLTAAGIDVVVLDSAPDVGGVWSATRSYPGLSTQNDKWSYSFSDLPMPEEFPENPAGEQMQRYLAAYAERHGLLPHLRLGTTVTSAAPRRNGRWTVRTSGPGGEQEEDADAVVLANGVFSLPHVPRWSGRDAFQAAGGQVLTPAALRSLEQVAGRRVLVVGWGKTACDLALAVSRRAASTLVVARQIRWKVPRRIAGVRVYRMVLLSRAGEFLRWHPTRTLLGRAARPLLVVPRKVALRLLQAAIARQHGMRRLGLLPEGGLANSNSQITPGFFPAVRAGRIAVRRDAGIAELLDEGGSPAVRLTDGTRMRADVIVAATGYDQDVSLFPPEVRERLLDPVGAMRLYRRIRPPRVPGLYFAGYSQSMFSLLGAEISALWILADLAGLVTTPPPDRQWESADVYLLDRGRTIEGRGAQVPGESIGDLDELLGDLGFALPRRVRLRQWSRPLDPGDYAAFLPRLLARIRSEAAFGQALSASDVEVEPRNT
jgi:dimethylaniline monooxygenase (N-oxide forming)